MDAEQQPGQQPLHDPDQQVHIVPVEEVRLLGHAAEPGA
jgi:hypothetical protein